MKMTRKMLVLSAVILALALAIPAFAEEGSQGNQGEGKGKKRGQRWEKMRGKIEENLPGAKEQFESHKKVMDGLHEEMKTLRKELRDAVKAKETAEEKKAVVESYEAKFRTLAGKFVDAQLDHATKMLALRKANRDAAVDNLLERWKDRAQNRMDGKGKGRGQGQGQGQGRGRHGDRGPRGPRGDDAPDDDEI